MLNRFMRHVRQQLVGYIALFIALGGVSYAALKLPANSVGTKQLKDGAVTGRKVKPNSLLAKDFKAGQLSPGPRGLQGPQGNKGDPGAPAAKYWARITYSGATPSVAASSDGITVANGGTGLTNVTFPAAVGVASCAFSITLDTAGLDGFARKSASLSTGSTAAVLTGDTADTAQNYAFDIVGFC
jgi:hypothetical protein